MAYAVIRTHTHAAKDATCTWRILKEGATASAALLALGQSPHVEWEPRSGQLIASVAPSTAALSVLRDTALSDAIALAGERDYRLDIDRGGAPWWRGYIVPDLSNHSTDVFATSRQLRAADGLHLLKAGQYLNGGAPWQEGDRATPIAILAELLAITGLGLDIRVASRLYPFGVTGGDPLAAITIDRTRFYDGDGNPPSPYGALLQLLRGLGQTLVQQRGAWHAVDVSLLGQGSYVAHVYDSAGAFQGTVTVNDVVSASSMLAGGRQEEREAISVSSHTYDHGPVSVLVNGTFEGAPYDAGWATHGGDFNDFKRFDRSRVGEDGVRRITSVMGIKGVFASPNEIGDTLVQYAGVRYRKLVSTSVAEIAGASLRHMISWRFFIDGNGAPVSSQETRVGFWARRIGNYWLQPDGSWQVGPGGIDWMSVDVATQWDSAVIESSIPPGGGVVETYLSLVVDNTSSSPVSYDIWAQWDDVLLAIQFGQGEEEWASTTTTLENTALAGAGLNESSSRFGQGPTLLNPSAILMADGSLAQSWKRGAYGVGESPSGDSFERVIAEHALRAFSAPQKRYIVRFMTAFAGDICPLTAVMIQGRATCALGLRRVLTEGIADGVFDERTDVAVPVRDEVVREEEAQVYIDSSGRASGSRSQSSLIEILRLTTLTAGLSAGVQVNSISVSPVSPQAAPLLASGARLFVINESGRPQVFNVAARAIESAASIAVGAVTPGSGVASGSSVFMSPYDVLKQATRPGFGVTEGVAVFGEDADENNATQKGEAEFKKPVWFKRITRLLNRLVVGTPSVNVETLDAGDAVISRDLHVERNLIVTTLLRVLSWALPASAGKWLRMKSDGSGDVELDEIEIEDVVNLQTALDGKSDGSHTHTIGEVDDLQDTLDGKSPLVHIHTVEQVQNLRTELDGKAAITHSHTISDVSDFPAAHTIDVVTDVDFMAMNVTKQTITYRGEAPS